AACDDACRACPQRDEDRRPECPARALRLPWLRVRAAPLPEGWPLVSGGEPVEEERAAAQGEGQRSAGARQHERLARGARPAQPPVAGLVDVLRLWHPPAGVPGDRQPRLRPGPPLPGTASQSPPPWPQPLPTGDGVQRARGAPPPARPLGTTAVCPAMKPVGKPDAGNPHVRFDERGGEPDLPRAVIAPLLDSTRGRARWQCSRWNGAGGNKGRVQVA